MPLYEYKCQKCGVQFEALRNLSDDDADLVCPKCGAAKPQRIVSSFASSTSGGDSESGCAPSGGG